MLIKGSPGHKVGLFREVLRNRDIKTAVRGKAQNGNYHKDPAWQYSDEHVAKNFCIKKITSGLMGGCKSCQVKQNTCEFQ